MIYNMSIFKNVMKAFSDELSYNKEYYTKKEQEKQREGKYNSIDIYNELRDNYNKMKQKNK
jgi:hypothetical protein